jgi:outer membrane cobalamin receptor
MIEASPPPPPEATVRASLVRLTPFLFCLVGACSHATASGPAAGDIIVTPEGRRIITEKAIERSGAHSVWDALQRTVPFFTFRESSRGPGRIEHRGRSSVVLRDQPMIIVDGTELTDFSVLSGMPASDLFEIEVLSGIDATTFYGTGATKGVIRLWTKLTQS